PARTEIFEHIGLGHSDVDIVQIEQVIKVGCGAVGDYWDNAQIVAVIKHLRQLTGERHVGARQLATYDANRPSVAACPHGIIGTTLFKRLWYRLRLRCSN